MARKLPRLERVLDAPALASVAYGEVASSIYFALGIIALHALGFTPAILGIVGALFLVVALSYAEGTAAIHETGGAATFVRVAFNDLAGFLTGWVLFLDYLIVIALSALFFPHYLGAALGINSIARHPGDAIAGSVVIALIAVSRLLRRTRLYTFGIAVPLLDLVTQLLLVVLGFGLLFSGERADARDVARHDAVVAPARVRAAAGDARVHRPRDRGESRGGGASAGARSAAQPVQRDRRRRRHLRADRARRAVGVPGVARHHRARRPVAAGSDHGHRLRAPAAPAALVRQRAPRLRRAYGRAGAARGRDDVDLRIRAARLLPRRARPAAARLRPAEPAHARRAGVGHRRGEHLDRAAALHGVPHASGHVPREPVQLRRAARLHGCAAGGGQAARRAARSAPPVPRPARGPHPRRASSRSRRWSARCSRARSSSRRW